jgi:hypothetical protein
LTVTILAHRFDGDMNDTAALEVWIRSLPS